MADADTQGWEGVFATSDSGTLDERFNFLSCDVRAQGSHHKRDGITGTRDQRSEDVRANTIQIGGRVSLEPTNADLTIWLPRILGGTVVSTSYPITETRPLPSFDCGLVIGGLFWTFEGCKVNSATFRGSSGGPITLELDILGLDYSEAAANTAPSLSITHAAPYLFCGDTTFTLAGNARDTNDFELTINNNLTARYMNSLTPVSIAEGPLDVTLRTSHAWGADTDDLHAQAVAGATGSLAIVNGTVSTTFTFGRLQVPTQTLAVQSKTQEVTLSLEMVARANSTTPSIAVTHDSTP